MNNVVWNAYPDATGAAQACAEFVATTITRALSGNDHATVAFSGGSTPVRMFESLVAMSLDWSRIQIFFVDERAVPPGDEQSNYKSADEHLFRPARIPTRNIHRMQGELPVDQAAALYAREIAEIFRLSPGELPYFDMVHLGMGADCHTASLFPGDARIADRDNLVAGVSATSTRVGRITLLPGVLLRARNIAVLAAGSDKAEPLRRVLTGPHDEESMPVQAIAYGPRQSRWFLDQAAAALLVDEPSSALR